MPTTSTPHAGIVTHRLVRRFGDLAAVDGIDLDIAPGEVYGFLGPNGAGKSTTVRMLCTLLAPHDGTAVVAGQDVVTAPDEVRLRIGVALQDVALDPRQTGSELLALQGRLYGMSRGDVQHRLGELSQLIDLGDAMDRRIGTYSGGMRRRVDLAAALIHRPSVLFLDEPTTGLDPVSRATVWEEVRKLNDQLGVTIFLTTQYLEEADALADRVGIIDGGRLAAEGAPDELKRTVGTDVIIARVDGRAADVPTAALERVPGVQHVEATADELIVSVTDGAAAVGPVAVALDGAAVSLRDLTLRTTTLDDVFLELTGSRIQADATPALDTADATIDLPAHETAEVPA